MSAALERARRHVDDNRAVLAEHGPALPERQLARLELRAIAARLYVLEARRELEPGREAGGR